MQAVRIIAEGDGPPLSLELSPNTAFDEWVAVGRGLCIGQQTLNWHIGDWWAFGDHRYGDRAKAAAEGLFGKPFGSLMNLAAVARSFETSRRREALTFTHHAEVAILPAAEADELLSRAERERWSTRELRHAAQALKGANDSGAAAEAEHDNPPSRPVPPQTTRANLTSAYEMVMEFAEALQQLRALTRREADLLAVAEAFVDEARAGHRPCPDDFDIIFVERGRLACEDWYKASRLTVNRWLIERGKTRLINKRAEFVRYQREQEAATRTIPAPHGDTAPIDDELHEVAAEAASFLRITRYGGWTITSGPGGQWLVGTVHKTSDELIAMAERQGFDSELAHAGHRRPYMQGARRG